MKALITAGGHGTRLRPITHTQNKHLILIANKPMLAYALEYVRDAGITEAGIVINKGDTEVQKVFGNGSELGISITYISQESPKGLAHVVKISQDFIGDDEFIFYLGDNILVGGIKKFIDSFSEKKSNCHLVLSEVPDPQRFGVPEINDHAIVGIEEKPEKPKSKYAVTGIYIYDNSIFEAVNKITPSSRGELEISDAHQFLLEKGYKISFSEITGWWKDTGKVSDLLDANRLVLESQENNITGDVDSASSISGRVRIGKGCKIVNSRIRGPVVVGRNVTIENAYLGPHTAIGNECRIVNSEVENSIFLERTFIENVSHRIADSLLGMDVQIRGQNQRPVTNRFMLGDQSRVELA
tara:strand:- start:4658 stop:5722 length:1065 start_codon:yes stop_codon:yes gene_type:complete